MFIINKGMQMKLNILVRLVKKIRLKKIVVQYQVGSYQRL